MGAAARGQGAAAVASLVCPSSANPAASAAFFPLPSTVVIAEVLNDAALSITASDEANSGADGGGSDGIGTKSAVMTMMSLSNFKGDRRRTGARGKWHDEPARGR
jgi:hypothetical protein